MNIFLISSAIFLITTLYFNYKKTIGIYIKKSLLPLIGIAFIAALIIYPETSVAAASKGIHLWLDIVFPSLFPFFVASQLLSKSGIIRLFGIILEPVMRPLFNVPGCGSFALAMGIVSGYPVGASITADLRKQELLSRVEAERLLTFTNNSGPLFIMGAVAVGMFKLPNAGYLLYASHVASCITVGLIFRFYKRHSALKIKSQFKMSQNIRLELQKLRNSDINPWTLFGECIKNSIFTILTIGGFIIFFSVLINIMIASGLTGYICGLVPGFITSLGLEPKTLEGLLCGIFEITTGSNLINLSSAELIIKLCATSLIIGWAGFSVHTQVMSIVSSSDIRVRPYLAGKALQGLISCVYTFIGYKIFSKLLFSDAPAFASGPPLSANSWNGIFQSSIQYITIVALIMIIVSAFYVFILSIVSRKKLF